MRSAEEKEQNFLFLGSTLIPWTREDTSVYAVVMTCSPQITSLIQGLVGRASISQSVIVPGGDQCVLRFDYLSRIKYFIRWLYNCITKGRKENGILMKALKAETRILHCIKSGLVIVVVH